MAEKNLAQMIRERMESERESCINAEVERQWNSVMEAIEIAAGKGCRIAQYPCCETYGYEGKAWLIVCDKLVENGFHVEHDRGTWIHW